MTRLTDRSIPRPLAGLLLACLLGFGSAIQPVLGDGADRRQAVEKRIEIADKYLKSKTARQINEGGNDQARDFLDKARQFLADARKDFDAGNLDRSQENADQSMRAFSAAAAANRKTGSNSARLAADNQAVETEIEAYLQSFRGALADKGPSMAGLLDQRRVDGLLARAKEAGAGGDHATAGRLLNEAKQLVVVALTKIRSNETVVYALEFQTPADEYRYEQERYQEYLVLSDKVLDDGDVGESKRKMFDRLRARSQDFNQMASDLAGKGDYESAIAQMEEALRKLVQGLQILGVPVSM